MLLQVEQVHRQLTSLVIRNIFSENMAKPGRNSGYPTPNSQCDDDAQATTGRLEAWTLNPNREDRAVSAR